MRSAALAAALFLLAGAVRAASLDAFTSTFGEDGVSALAERGYLIVQGKGGERRLTDVHWKALEAFAQAARSCRTLAVAAADLPPAAADIGLGPCRALPGGAMTERLRALAAVVDAEGQERWALVVSSASLAEPPGVPNLFETRWGKELAARRRADRLEDPAPLAKGYFEEYLAGPTPDSEAVKHFTAVLTARGVAGIEAKLAADASRGAATDELRALIRRYLQDERRRRVMALDDARRKALASDKAVKRDLDALASLSSTLEKPDLLPGLEASVSAAEAPSGPPRLRSAGFHLREPVRLGQYELGDEAYVSGAYWVDGLPEGRSVPVEETTWVETQAGYLSVQTRVVKRANGGPYPYERTLTVTETKAFAVAARVSASSGAALGERVEVAVAPDYELSLQREAEVLQDLQACDPKSAETAASALAGLIDDAAQVKPQYKALLRRVRDEKKRAAADQELLAKLEEATAAARTDSSPEQCRYETKRTDAAVKLARSLPPGCDRVLPELFAQRALVSRRARDQAWFLKASAEARSRRKSCDFEAAAERWTEALAVLDADPAARCGPASAEAKAAEAELVAVRRSARWSRAMADALTKAETETVPEKRLALTAPVIARLASLEDGDCRRDLLRRARKLSDKAGEDASAPSDVEALLPDDKAGAAVLAEVRRSRDRRIEKAAAADAPPAAVPAPEPPPPPPAKEPKIRKKAAPKHAPKAKAKKKAGPKTPEASR